VPVGRSTRSRFPRRFASAASAAHRGPRRGPSGSLCARSISARTVTGGPSVRGCSILRSSDWLAGWLVAVSRPSASRKITHTGNSYPYDDQGALFRVGANALRHIVRANFGKAIRQAETSCARRRRVADFTSVSDLNFPRQLLAAERSFHGRPLSSR